MNRNVFLLLILTAFIFGCAQQKPLTLAMSGIENCVASQPRGKCPTGEGKTNNLTIHLINGVPSVNRPDVCAKEKTELTVNITPANTDIKVFLVPEDTKNGWILASNSRRPDKMTISIPEHAGGEDGKEYKYFVLTSNGHCIDPRIYVD
jgi:hypothetical protein